MLIPPELYDGYQRRQQQQAAPEIRLQDDIESLLDRENLADDIKAKILGHLITRFQKVTHEPLEPIPVSMVNNKAEEKESKNEQVNNTTPNETDGVVRDILRSVPKTHAKFVPIILEKLNTRLYSWNERGEFVINNSAVKNSKMVDFFTYLMRNSKRAEEPNHFYKFLSAVNEINIPMSWIANERVVKLIKKGGPDINSRMGEHSMQTTIKSRTARDKFSEASLSESDSPSPAPWKVRSWIKY